MYLEVGGDWKSFERCSAWGWGANDLPDRRTCLWEVRCRISLSGLGVGRNHIFTDVFEST